MKVGRPTIRRLYKEAIISVFGCGDKELDKELVVSTKNDIHLGGKDPGGYGSNALLSVYCESGIPNASDIHDFSYEYKEFGIEGNPVLYNSEKWDRIDEIVNLYLNAVGSDFTVFHEPYNHAVVNVYSVI
tara:strand:+ start:166 stop:555 length:390 start_codon:yes stop_codon:yes gene_type:complete